MNLRQRVALGLAAFPFIIQVPFSLLAARFNYPDVLKNGAESLLPAFHAGGASLVAVWYLYALAIVPFLVASIGLPAALGAVGTRARMLLGFGITSAVAQMVALMRWTFVVPYLAERYVADPAGQKAVAVVFEMQHRLFGALLGEHVGQLTLAAWTFAVVSSIPNTGFGRVLRPSGVVAGGLFLAGLVEGLASPLNLSIGALAHAPLVAFLTWSIWLVALGVWLFNRRAD